MKAITVVVISFFTILSHADFELLKQKIGEEHWGVRECNVKKKYLDEPAKLIIISAPLTEYTTAVVSLNCDEAKVEAYIISYQEGLGEDIQEDTQDIKSLHIVEDDSGLRLLFDLGQVRIQSNETSSIDANVEIEISVGQGAWLRLTSSGIYRPIIYGYVIPLLNSKEDVTSVVYVLQRLIELPK